MSKYIPEILKNHILPFNWSGDAVWALEAPVLTAPRVEYDYLLNLPLWSSVAGRRMLFDTKPIDVINDPNISAYQTTRLKKVDATCPLDFLIHKGRKWILDGVHRLAKLYILQEEMINVRLHTDTCIPAIKICQPGVSHDRAIKPPGL